MKPVRKRILHKIKIDEISAVDRPAQEGALMQIMKRADPPHLTKLEDQLLILRDRVDRALVKYSSDQPRDEQGQWTSAGTGGGESSPSPASPSVPSNRLAWLKSALENVAIGAALRSGPVKHAVGNIVFRLLTAASLTNPYVATLTAGAAITGVRITGLLNYLDTALDLVRAARNAEIKKLRKVEQDPILIAIANAKRALAAFKRSEEYKQAQAKETKEPTMSLDHHAREIAKRDGCNGVTALRRARTEHPGAYQEYNIEPLRKASRSFDALVEEEIAKGFPSRVAAQRVASVYGVHPPRETNDDRRRP